MDLLATHDFQTGLQNYLDLSDLRRKLAAWDTSFDAFDEMVDIRRAHYEPLLPDIDHEFRKLDSRIRLRSEQHAVLIKRREDLLRTPRPEFLASRVEQEMIARIDAIEDQLLDAGYILAPSATEPLDEKDVAKSNFESGPPATGVSEPSTGIAGAPPSSAMTAER